MNTKTLKEVNDEQMAQSTDLLWTEIPHPPAPQSLYDEMPDIASTSAVGRKNYGTKQFEIEVPVENHPHHQHWSDGDRLRIHMTPRVKLRLKLKNYKTFVIGRYKKIYQATAGFENPATHQVAWTTGYSDTSSYSLALSVSMGGDIGAFSLSASLTAEYGHSHTVEQSTTITDTFTVSAPGGDIVEINGCWWQPFYIYYIEAEEAKAEFLEITSGQFHDFLGSPVPASYVHFERWLGADGHTRNQDENGYRESWSNYPIPTWGFRLKTDLGGGSFGGGGSFMVKAENTIGVSMSRDATMRIFTSFPPLD